MGGNVDNLPKAASKANTVARIIDKRDIPIVLYILQVSHVRQSTAFDL